MTSNHPRIMIAGTGSGCGKTTITCGLLKALSNKGLKVSAFKSGPDYIDPMFHSRVIGTKSRNLDLFLCGEETVKYLMYKNSMGSDISVVEGVMGLYDGLGGNSDIASANHLSQLTDTPQILVLSTKGLSLSVVAMVEGYVNFKKNNIKGVILNQTNKGMYPLYKDMIDSHFGGRIKVYGYLPPMAEAELGSRHLGLITPAEIADINHKLNTVAETVEETIDLQGIISLSQTAPAINYTKPTLPTPLEKPIKIAVAQDNGFCFYYEDTLELIEELGGQVVHFSPIRDSALPHGVSGLILGGGYPEEYLKELSENTSMRNSVKSAIENGMPTIAECGGFMYLTQYIENHSGDKIPMVGAVEGGCFMTSKLVRFGYKTLKAKEDNLLLKKGETVPCHEFHYSDCTDNGSDLIATKGSRRMECIHGSDSLFAGYPHIHWWGNLDCFRNFLDKAEIYHQDNNL